MRRAALNSLRKLRLMKLFYSAATAQEQFRETGVRGGRGGLGKWEKVNGEWEERVKGFGGFKIEEEI